MVIDDNTDGLVLEILSVEDSVGQWVDKQNANFRAIIQHGGGKQGPPGPQGVPGHSTSEIISNIIDNIPNDLVLQHSIDCNANEIRDFEDVLMNKRTNTSLLLTNITDRDSFLEIREDENDLSATYSSENFKNHKLKIISSNLEGKGNHIAFLNSKAIQNNKEFLCKSGFNISLDYVSDNEELLNIEGIKNTSISGHRHVSQQVVDRFDIRRRNNSQRISFDAKQTSESNYNSLFELVELTNNRNLKIPDRTGFLGVWQDTLENSESWESIFVPDLKTKRFRYSNGTGFHEIAEDESIASWVYLNNESRIKFKRMNNFVLIDFHLNVTHYTGHGNFSLENIQFVVDKETVSCGTSGWHTATVLQDESYIPTSNSSLGDFCFFNISATAANSFLVSIRFPNNRGIHFTDTLRETYWITGQVWATIQSFDESCIILDIDQSEDCPVIDIVTDENSTPVELRSTIQHLYDWNIYADYSGSKESIDCEILKTYVQENASDYEYNYIIESLAPMQGRYVLWNYPDQETYNLAGGITSKMFVWKDENGADFCKKIGNIIPDSGSGTGNTLEEICINVKVPVDADLTNYLEQGYILRLPQDNPMRENSAVMFNTVVRDKTNKVNGQNVTLIPFHQVNVMAPNILYILPHSGINLSPDYEFQVCFNGYIPATDGLTWMEKHKNRIIPELTLEALIENDQTVLISKRNYNASAATIFANCIDIQDQYYIDEILYVKNVTTNTTYTFGTEYNLGVKEVNLNNSSVPNSQPYYDIIVIKENVVNGFDINDIIEVKYSVVSR